MRILTFIALILISSPVFAESKADSFFLQGQKFYVVAGVAFIIFLGIFLFLRRLDKRLNKLEKENDINS